MTKLGSPRIAVTAILLLILSLFSYSLASVHVLAVGDYPHDMLKPVYGLSQVQIAWIGSLGGVPWDRIEKFDAILVDPSAAPYAEQEPWEDKLTAYVRKGGTLIKVTQQVKLPGGNEITSQTNFGKGKLINVISSNPQWNSPDWAQSKHFWLEIFRNSVSQLRVTLLDMLPFLFLPMLVLFIFSLVLKYVKTPFAEGVAGGEDSRQASIFQSPHSLPLQWVKQGSVYIAFLAIALLVTLPWIVGWKDGEIMWSDEAAHSLATIHYYVNYFHQYHSIPLVYDSSTYSQPMDFSYYLRTPTNFIPMILSLILGLDATGAVTASSALLLFGTLSATYYFVHQYTKSTASSFTSAILYVFSGYALFTMYLSSVKLFLVLFLIPLLAIGLHLYMRIDGKKSLSLLALSTIIYAWFIGINAYIAAIGLVSILVVMLFTHEQRQHWWKLATAGLICGTLTGIYLFFVKSISLFLFPPHMRLINYQWHHAPNLLQSLALTIGPNNPLAPGTVSIGADFWYTLICFLPLGLASVAIVYKRRLVLAYLLGLLLLALSTGVNGPLGWLYLHTPFLPFRASGRTFMPVAAFIFVFLAGVGMAIILDKLRVLNVKRSFRYIVPAVSISLIGFVLGVGMSTSRECAKTYNVPAEVEQAYQQIPHGSQVLVLPMCGPRDFGLSLSAPEVRLYKQDAIAGHFISHLHMYEVNKNHLREAYAPINVWEVPPMTNWFFSMMREKLASWNDSSGAIGLLNSAPNLQYLVIYKKLVPQSILEAFSTNSELEKAYENDLMLVYKRVDSTLMPILESKKAFLLYCGSYRYALPSITRLTNGKTPVLMGETPWYIMDLQDIERMNNLTIVAQNTSLDDVAMIYALTHVKEKIIINPDDSLAFSETNFYSSRFWQPSINASILTTTTSAPYSQSFTISAEGTYDIFIRTACNGKWQGSLNVSLDGRFIGRGYFPVDKYGPTWLQIGTFDLTHGKHELTFINTQPGRPVGIDAIAIVDHQQYLESSRTYRDKLKDIVSQKDYLAIYEVETNSTGLYQAMVTGDWSDDPATYPSGGWPRGQSVKLAPRTNILRHPADFIVNKERTVPRGASNPEDSLWTVAEDNSWAYLHAGETSDPLTLAVPGLDPNRYYSIEIGIWSDGARTGEFTKDGYSQILESPNVEPRQMNWIPIDYLLRSSGDGTLTFVYTRGTDLSKPSSLDDIKVTRVAELSINVDIPVSQEYYITVREKGTSKLMLDGERQDPLQSYSDSSTTWTYTVYRGFLSEGKHIVSVLSGDEQDVWVDCVYVSTKPLPDVTVNTNPECRIEVIDASKYRMVSTDDQSRYVLLMKSYFPSWRVDSDEKTFGPYLSNAFLTGFYVEGREYTIQFKPGR